MTIKFCLLGILVFTRELRVNLLIHFHHSHVLKGPCNGLLLIKITIFWQLLNICKVYVIFPFVCRHYLRYIYLNVLLNFGFKTTLPSKLLITLR